MRLAILFLLLGLFGGFVLLWLLPGGHSAYLALLGATGLQVGVIPFLDMHGLVSAVECHHLGFDVFRTNPCDILGRRHGYSPLWLDLMPASLSVGDTNPLGLSLDLLFIASLPVILRPRSWAEAGSLALAAASPMAVFALERANVDLMLFLLIAAAGALHRREAVMRALAYALLLLGALLKYYPAVGLVLMLRERGRAALIALASAAAVFVGFVIFYARILPSAFLNVTRVKSVYGESFSARNLPEGVAGLWPSLPPAGATLIAAAVLLVLLLTASRRVWRLMPLIEPAALDSENREATNLLLGATVLVGCFFAGDNIYYRGIFFLLTLPGLLGLRRITARPELRHALTQMLVGVLFLMWSECLRHALYALFAATMPPTLAVGLELLFWGAREWLWWWAIAFYAALLLAAMRHAPLLQEVTARLQHWRSAMASPRA